MNETPRQGVGSRAARAFVRLLVTLLVVGMAGAVVFLLSQLNARTFTLELHDGQLVVMKGRMMPWGAAPFRPSDARLADAYAPIAVEGKDVSALLTQRFSERDELDRTLFPLMESLARPRIASDEPQRVERGVYYLRRAELLSGITEAQRTTLKGLTAEVAYYQARQKLDEARKLIAEAVAQLKLAAEGDNRHSRSATEMLSKVGPAASALEQSLREAVHTLSLPRTPETPTPPAATPPAAAPPTPAPPAPSPTPGAVITDSETQTRPPDMDTQGGDTEAPAP